MAESTPKAWERAEAMRYGQVHTHAVDTINQRKEERRTIIQRVEGSKERGSQKEVATVRIKFQSF
jgi:hypothetical protein